MHEQTQPGHGLLIVMAASSAAAAVGLGAYGAHGLQVDDAIRAIWETGVQYQMWHALGAFAALFVASKRGGQAARFAALGGWALLIGSWLFSVSLYWFVIDGIVPVTGMAPAGGIAMIIGWLGVGAAALIKP